MKADRLVSMVTILRRPEPITLSDLASQLHVSRRTVIRDLAWLSDAGFEIATTRGRHGGVRLAAGARIDVERLGPSEIDLLRIAGLDARQLDALGLASSRTIVDHKLRAHGPGPAMAIADLVVVDNSPWLSGEAPALVQSVLAALRRQQRWRISYRSTGSAMPRALTVDPYGILVKSGRWYLVADHLGSPRLFNLARLQAWTPVSRPSKHRAGQSLATVAATLIRKTDERGPLSISANFPHAEADRARRMLGGKVLEAIPVDDETIRITIGCNQLQDVRDLLPFIDRIGNIEPSEARELVAQILRDALAIHAERSDGEPR